MTQHNLTIRDDSCTGIETIDRQHREIIEHYNDLLCMVATRSDSAVHTAALDRIVEAAKYHFWYEEKLLEESGYPDLASHRAEHARLLEQITAWAEQSRQGRLNLSSGTLKLIRSWLLSHMAGSDQQYVAHVNAARCGDGPVTAAKADPQLGAVPAG